MTDWTRIRAAFPVTRERAYFMSAAMSPLPEPVARRAAAEYQKLADAGDIHWFEDLERYRSLRERIGTHIGATADDCIVMPSTSAAMSVLALTLARAFGKELSVVSMRDEFPATTVPFEYQGVRMRYVDPIGARYPVEAILETIADDTRAVVTSYVQYATGFRQKLAALGRELRRRDILFIVNATQAFPLFPIDVEAMGIDAMTASLHKWGFAGQVGSLFFTSPRFRERFPAPTAGWLSIAPDEGDFILTSKNSPLHPHASADRYHQGCFNLQAIGALDAAFAFLTDIGFDAIRERLFALGDHLIAGLRKREIEIVSPVASREERSAITAFRLAEKTQPCYDALLAKNIFPSLRAGNIRVAVNVFNTEEEIDRLLAIVDHFR